MSSLLFFVILCILGVQLDRQMREKINRLKPIALEILKSGKSLSTNDLRELLPETINPYAFNLMMIELEQEGKIYISDCSYSLDTWYAYNPYQGS